MEGLESEIAEWRAFVGQGSTVDGRDVDELEDHLRGQIADLTASGLAADEAFVIAVKRMGSLDELPVVSRRTVAICTTIAAVLTGCSASPGTGTHANSTMTSAVSENTSTAPSPTTAAESVTRSSVRGWIFNEIPFTIREGSAYAVGDGWFFAWGGAPDRSGSLMSDGLLVDIDSGAWLAVPEAPIEARYLAAVVWTGSEFIVFGGHSFYGSFVDGAAFDPADMTWRDIDPAPLSPAAYPSARWTGREMVVWLAERDSEPARLPSPGAGQMAAYDPDDNTWRRLDAPPVLVVDAMLLASGDVVTLLGGPTMRDLGTIGFEQHMTAARYDLDTNAWSQPVEGPVVESARPFKLEDGRIAVLTDDGSVYVFDGVEWRILAALPEPCWFDLGAASGGGAAYLKSCGANHILYGTSVTSILGEGEYGTISNLYGSAFLATEDGKLIVMGDADPAEGSSGIVVFGVYDD